MEQLRSNVTDTALVFEGGGMRASYTSALACELLAARIHVDWVAGISAGASNAANYLSRDAARTARSFVDFAADPNFGGPGSFLRGRGWFNAEYIYEHAGSPGQAMPFDFATYLANPARANFGAFRCDTGEQEWFTKADTPTIDALMRRVRASSTMPGLMPVVNIGGIDYVDGALGPSGGIPIDRAEQAGFRKFLVVLTRPRDYLKQPLSPSRRRLFARLFHRHPAVTEALATRPGRYNRTREKLFDLEAGGQARLFVPAAMPVSNAEQRVSALRASFRAGLSQARRELPEIADFLGVDVAVGRQRS